VAILIEKQVWILPLIIATIANSLGSISTFWIGKKAGELTIHKLSDSNQKRAEQAKRIIHKYGAFAMILGWIPFLGDVIIGIGGALQLPFWKSTFWITIGKLGRYGILVYVTLLAKS
jgi:membrane protein YqaA with SNARE-associated domain